MLILSRLPVFRLSSVFLTSILLGACSSNTVEPTAPSSLPSMATPMASNNSLVNNANNAFQAGNLRQAAEDYFAAADQYPSPERERLMLQATEIAASLENTDLMRQYLNPLDPAGLNNETKPRYQYTLGLMALLENQPIKALQLLPSNFQVIDEGLRVKVLEARLRAARNSQQVAIEVMERIKQNNFQKFTAQDKNKQLIWQQLGKLDPRTLEQLRQRERDTYARGWLDLAFIDRLSPETTNINASLKEWNQRFAKHPAGIYSNNIARRAQEHMMSSISVPETAKLIPEAEPPAMLPPVDNTQMEVAQAPSERKPAVSNISVLLPLSGGMKNISATVVRGLKAKHAVFNEFDTSSIDASVQYNAATNTQADVIIGPFAKKNLAAIARNNNLSVPMLSLNYLPETIKPPKNLHQFGLLPEDEAEQIARYAKLKGKRKALIITPNSAWGTRLANAFSKAFIASGGKVIKQVSYQQSAADAVIMSEQLMREQADMVFMAGAPNQARKVYPALQTANAQNIPIIATSHIFSGNPLKSADSVLDGIIYTEIPWLLNAISQKSAEVNKRYPRLYALGQDAIEVAKNLEKLQNGGRINGKTGIITYAPNQRLHRESTMATFKNGLPVKL